VTPNRECPPWGAFCQITLPSCFVSNTRWLFGNFATADFRQIWPRHANRGWNSDFGEKFMKSFHSGVICTQNPILGGGQTGTSLTAGYRSRDARHRYIVYSTLDSGQLFLYDVRLRRYRVSKLPNFRILAYFPHTKLLKHTFWWPAYSPGVTSQNDYGVFLRLLVGELGTPNLPKFSPMANGYTHTECYYTARQICTKYVWKRAILRTDVLSHQIFSPLPLKSTQNPIFGDLSMQTYYTESSP